MSVLHSFPTNQDLEEFAETFLNCDYDDFYATYFGISDEDLDEWYKESEEFVEY
jgi:hypothetical protein